MKVLYVRKIIFSINKKFESKISKIVDITDLYKGIKIIKKKFGGLK